MRHRHTAHLRWGRVSIPGATYFVTHCTRDRVPVLTGNNIAIFLTSTWCEMHASGDIHLRAGIVMPDHSHALFVLGNRLSLGQVLGKFKSLARDHGRAEWKWQEDGFEHRLREHESPEDYAFYIFMNPYRAGLITVEERWPWWVCPEPSCFAFLAQLRPDEPIPLEWLPKSVQLAGRLSVS